MQHLKRAHSLWRARLSPGDLAVDATCGNGHDTAVLVETGARVLACDIQPAAIMATRSRIGDLAELHNVCHTALENILHNLDITILVYNLGYLPGGDKTITTHTSTTLKSLKTLLWRLAPGGLVTLMCYPGHPEGAREQIALLEWSAQLPTQWFVTHHRFNQKATAPTLLTIERISGSTRQDLREIKAMNTCWHKP